MSTGTKEIVQESIREQKEHGFFDYIAEQKKSISADEFARMINSVKKKQRMRQGENDAT